MSASLLATIRSPVPPRDPGEAVLVGADTIAALAAEDLPLPADTLVPEGWDSLRPQAAESGFKDRFPNAAEALEFYAGAVPDQWPDSDNARLVVAGGAALAALGVAPAAHDVDLFLVGDWGGVPDALIRTYGYMCYGQNNWLLEQRRGLVTFIADPEDAPAAPEDLTPPTQIIARPYATLTDLLGSFDLPICGAALVYRRGAAAPELHATPAALWGIVRRTAVVGPGRCSTTLDLRMAKYFARGVALHFADAPAGTFGGDPPRAVVLNPGEWSVTVERGADARRGGFRGALTTEREPRPALSIDYFGDAQGPGSPQDKWDGYFYNRPYIMHAAHVAEAARLLAMECCGKLPVGTFAARAAVSQKGLEWLTRDRNTVLGAARSGAEVLRNRALRAQTTLAALASPGSRAAAETTNFIAEQVAGALGLPGTRLASAGAEVVEVLDEIGDEAQAYAREIPSEEFAVWVGSWAGGASFHPVARTPGEFYGAEQGLME